MIKSKPILVYDADCKLCRNAVRALKRSVESDRLEFIASSDPRCDLLLELHDLPVNITGRSVVLIEGSKTYLKSTAIIRSLHLRGGIWKAANILRIIPAFIRNLIYDVIARFRK